MAITSNTLPETGFVRLAQIVGQKSDPSKYKRKRSEITGLLPISRTAFLNGVKSGKYPKPINLGERTVAWRVQDIRDLLKRLGA